jgi:hypothetical protein
MHQIDPSFDRLTESADEGIGVSESPAMNTR